MNNLLKAITNLFRKKKPVLGIDIGTNSIKLTEIAKEDGGLRLLHIGTVTIPEGCIQEGMISNKEVFEQLLLQLISTSDAIANDVILSICSKNIIIRQLRLPSMPEKELRQAVEWETEKYIPLQKDSLHIDFINFGEIQSAQNKQLNILVAASPKDMLYTYHEIFTKMGFNLLAIEVLPIALWYGVAMDFKSDNKEEVCFILELGAQSTTVVIYRNQKLMFTRSIPIGGNEIDKSIAMILAIPEDEAKHLKEKHGIVDPLEDVTGFPDDPAEKLQFAIKGTLKDLLQEVQRSINFYQIQDRNAQIAKIMVVGGLANLKNISQFISKELNLPSEIIAPDIYGLEGSADKSLKKVTLNPSFITAFGLARREVE